MERWQVRWIYQENAKESIKRPNWSTSWRIHPEQQLLDAQDPSQENLKADLCRIEKQFGQSATPSFILSSDSHYQPVLPGHRIRSHLRPAKRIPKSTKWWAKWLDQLWLKNIECTIHWWAHQVWNSSWWITGETHWKSEAVSPRFPWIEYWDCLQSSGVLRPLFVEYDGCSISGSFQWITGLDVAPQREGKDQLKAALEYWISLLYVQALTVPPEYHGWGGAAHSRLAVHATCHHKAVERQHWQGCCGAAEVPLGARTWISIERIYDIDRELGKVQWHGLDRSLTEEPETAFSDSIFCDRRHWCHLRGDLSSDGAKWFQRVTEAYCCSQICRWSIQL